MIFKSYVFRQKEFSEQTFGPGIRKGVVDHIRKELKEVEDSDYKDLEEWIDIIILGIDGAWRTGATPDEVEQALWAKFKKNLERQWPDWRTVGTDLAIEHIRGEDE